MNVFIIDNTGKLWEFNNVFDICNSHHGDEIVMIKWSDDKNKNHWHWFTCAEIVTMEIFV